MLIFVCYVNNLKHTSLHNHNRLQSTVVQMWDVLQCGGVVGWGDVFARCEESRLHLKAGAQAEAL